MVQNLDKVLDEGILKYIVYHKMIPKHLKDFQDNLQKLQSLRYELDYLKRTWSEGEDCFDYENYNQKNEEWENLYDKFYEDYMWEKAYKIKDSPKISKFMGVKPFYPCVMFNISPNWKGHFNSDNGQWNYIAIKYFRFVIESYLNETFNEKKRYSRYKYCLECGSEGNFLHAHIVAEINPNLSKAVKTHINKGNHKQQLCKYWDKKMKGRKGCLKGKFAVQRIIINNAEILEDKLKYLYEKNKQDGHKNKYDLGLVFGDL